MDEHDTVDVCFPTCLLSSQVTITIFFVVLEAEERRLARRATAVEYMSICGLEPSFKSMALGFRNNHKYCTALHTPLFFPHLSASWTALHS